MLWRNNAQGYYQESGRAGRDGLPAECILMMAPRDYPRLFQLLRKGGRAARAKFQAGMELLQQVELQILSRTSALGRGIPALCNLL